MLPIDPRGRAPSPQPSSGNLNDLMGAYGVPSYGPSSGFGGGSSSLNSQVYVGGYSRSHQTYVGGAVGYSYSRTPHTKSIQQMLDDFYGNWSRGRVRALGAKFVAAGWISQENSSNTDAVGEAYQKALELAARKYAAGSNVTVGDVLNRWIGGAGGGAGGAAAMPSSYTTRTESVDLTNPKSAKAMLSQTLQQRLGRAPSGSEIHAFIGALHEAQRDDPTVRKTTYKLNPSTRSYNVSKESTSGGVQADAYLSDWSGKHNEKEYGAYQAATTYFDALMQAISAPASGNGIR